MGSINKYCNKIKKVGFVKSLKIAVRRLEKPLVPIKHAKRWKKCVKNTSYTGVTPFETGTDEIIISLTSYPKRINEIHLTIQSLLMQEKKPNKVILWLAESQFPEKENDLPEQLLNLVKYGLDIMWCEDYRSYKKLVPTLKLYPEAIIVTVDDDMYYHPQMLKRLYEAYLKNPDVIHCHRGTKYEWNNSDFTTIPGGYETYGRPSYLHKLTGCSGVLYPPHSLYSDVINSDLFMSLAPTNDDLWFWLMGVMNDTKTNIIPNNLAELCFVGNSQDDALNYVNDMGQNLLIEQRNNIFNYYHTLKTKVIND